MRERIADLVEQVKSQPNNQVPVLQLAHLYAQVWIKTQNAELVPRIMQCLQRAVSLEDGSHTAQMTQFMQGLGKQFAARQMAEQVTQLRQIYNQLNAKTQSAKTDTPAAKSAQAPAEAKQAVPQPAAESAPAQVPSAAGPRTGEETQDADDLPVPELSDAEIEARSSSAQPEPEESTESSSPEMEVEVKVETVKPDSSEQAETEAELLRKRREMDHRQALETAEGLSHVKELFEEEQVEEIVQFYAGCMEPREKRHVAEELVKRIEDWGIAPVLAIAAVESDQKVFRQIMRMVLQSNRTTVCQEIELTSYSPDLQRVAIVVLSELGIRAALPKLRAALEADDIIVRSVAVYGLGRAGQAAQKYLPDIVNTLESDPHINVRRAAAKALVEIGTQEALDAFEAAANRKKFEPAIYLELDKLRSRLHPDKETGPSGHGPQSAAATEKTGMSAKTKKNLLATVVVLALIGVLGFFVWKKLKPFFVGPDYGPSTGADYR